MTLYGIPYLLIGNPIYMYTLRSICRHLYYLLLTIDETGCIVVLTEVPRRRYRLSVWYERQQAVYGSHLPNWNMSPEWIDECHQPEGLTTRLEIYQMPPPITLHPPPVTLQSPPASLHSPPIILHSPPVTLHSTKVTHNSNKVTHNTKNVTHK